MVMTYIKKPQKIEAVQWDGTNFKEIQSWCKWHLVEYEDGSLGVPTLEGMVRAQKDDYIVRGTQGDYYPCKANVFQSVYERA